MARASQMFLEIFVILVGMSADVNGHGRLIQPVCRSSMWRYKYSNPLIVPYASIVEANYQDNELFCGGFSYQQNLGGKCGVCGDPYDQERHNEAGGKYAKGIIVEQYEIGQIIKTKIELTASHKGFFEFRLCPVNDPDVPATQECLDENLLTFPGKGDQTKWNLPDPTFSSGIYEIDVKLPDGLDCSQCVLQWRYHTGNSWGVDPDGRGCIGCGPQEEFYGCADIAIGEYMVSPTPMATSTIRSTTSSTISSATTKSTTDNNGGQSTCIHGEYAANGQECDSYLWCINSIWTTQYCVPGLVIGEAGPPICDWTYNVSPPCGLQTTRAPDLPKSDTADLKYVEYKGKTRLLPHGYIDNEILNKDSASRLINSYPISVQNQVQLNTVTLPNVSIDNEIKK